MFTPRRLLAIGFAAVAGLSAGCGNSEPPPPNVLWIVWDTTRADRMSLYGHDQETTPRLDAWAAENARVFEDCLSVASSTVPSHAAMFTGLLPTEHAMSNSHLWLEDDHHTIAERLKEAGYRTYLWSANPHLSEEENFLQGFETERHPWDPDLNDRTLAILREKVAPSPNQEYARQIMAGAEGTWVSLAAGELAAEDLKKWLDQGSKDRPYFAFVNYMEAHRPLVPRKEYRDLFMTPEEVARSFEIDFAWVPTWEYAFGLREFAEDELDILKKTYDAAVRELDDLFIDMLDELRAGGHLDNTIVVLVGDHGDLLGEHHMLDHQYNLYDQVLRVPLVVSWPGNVEVGRESAPVMNFDVFPTLLELTGIDEVPAGLHAKSLLSPSADRTRLSEYPSVFSLPIQSVQGANPDWDPAPWLRKIRALHDGPRKVLMWEDGESRIFDLEEDPGETTDISSDVGPAMVIRLAEFAAGLSPRVQKTEKLPEMSEGSRNALENLGYAGR